MSEGDPVLENRIKAKLAKMSTQTVGGRTGFNVILQFATPDGSGARINFNALIPHAPDKTLRDMMYLIGTELQRRGQKAS